MKYWLLTTEYPPFFGGGIGTYCYFTAKMMAARGHEVSVFVNDTAVADVEITKHEGIRLIRFHPQQTGSIGFLGHTTNISYEFAAIVRKFAEHEGVPDLLEAQEYLGIAYYILQFRNLQYDWCRNLRVLVTMHSPSFLYMEYNHVSEYRYPNYWICEMERYCLQAADILVSPSRFMIDELGKRFVLNRKQIAIVPNPFSAAAFQPVSVPEEEKNEIVFFGKLTVQKGAFKLLTYFKQLWDEGFTRPLYLLGGQDIVYHPEGKTMGDLIRLRYRNYISRGLLVLENKIAPSGIAARLARAEVVIIPSCNDNLPYVVFEMMSLGKVLLVSQQGGQYEVIGEGKTGFVFDHTHPETFGTQLKRILALPAAEKEKIGAAARQQVLSYDPANIYPRKMQAIEGVAQAADHIFPLVRPMKNAVSTSLAAENSLLSVIVPYFNMGRFIGETIQSLEAVDYAHREILIINDGSTEKTSLEILDRYRNRPGIRVYDTPNKGLAHARNFGAEKANGVFMAFLDADDKVDPTYYSKAIRVLGAYENLHFVGAWTRYFEKSSNTWPTFTPEPPLILYHNLVNSSALVYKRSSFLAAGTNDRNMLFQGLEDYESVVSMVASGFAGTVLPEPLFHYRVRKNSMIRHVSRTKKLMLIQHISRKHKEFYATFAAELFNLLNANGPGIQLDNPTLDLHLSDKIPFLGKLSGRVIYLIKRNKVARKAAYKLYRFINK